MGGVVAGRTDHGSLRFGMLHLMPASSTKFRVPIPVCQMLAGHCCKKRLVRSYALFSQTLFIHIGIALRYVFLLQKMVAQKIPAIIYGKEIANVSNILVCQILDSWKPQLVFLKTSLLH